jgi:hypothetical protein
MLRALRVAGIPFHWHVQIAWEAFQDVFRIDIWWQTWRDQIYVRIGRFLIGQWWRSSAPRRFAHQLSYSVQRLRAHPRRKAPRRPIAVTSPLVAAGGQPSFGPRALLWGACLAWLTESAYFLAALRMHLQEECPPAAVLDTWLEDANWLRFADLGGRLGYRTLVLLRAEHWERTAELYVTLQSWHAGGVWRALLPESAYALRRRSGQLVGAALARLRSLRG